MIFNLNEFLIAISFTLDFVEMDILGVVTNHSKRVAYISLKIGERLGMSREEIFDLVSLAILHDNGASQKILHDKLEGRKKEGLGSIESKREHGIMGEQNVREYPFFTNVHNVIKYHHENYDGTGFFGIRGEEIPVMSQIIKLADSIELNSFLKDSCMSLDEKQRIRAFIQAHQGRMFSPRLVEAFCEVSEKACFWMDLKDDFINNSLKRYVPPFSRNLPLQDIHRITQVFSRIIDAKSEFTQEHSRGLSQKAAVMCEFYGKAEEETYKLMIAADLHDLGKLAVSNTILDKTGKLDQREFDMIKQHTYLTRVSLQEIQGFEEITEWAANHHERLDGRGYPYGKTAVELDFNSRLLACLDIYQALMEERPYRNSLKHGDAIAILEGMGAAGGIDGSMVRDIHRVFEK